MKVIILDGSHNKNGMTVRLVESFIEGVRSAEPDADIKRHDLLNEKIEFCKGCVSCMSDKDPINAKCIINDAAIEIKKEALDCDVVVFATPIYEFCVSSAMKRFLERCATLVSFRFGVTSRAKPIKDKQGVILCSSGAPFPFNYLMGVTRYPNFILKLSCRLFRCSKTTSLFAGGMRISKKEEDKWRRKAFDLGAKITKRYQDSRK